MQDVVLRIRQGHRAWDLGSADAGTATNNQLGHITWTVTLPNNLKRGTATLAARGGAVEKLSIYPRESSVG